MKTMSKLKRATKRTLFAIVSSANDMTSELALVISTTQSITALSSTGKHGIAGANTIKFLVLTNAHSLDGHCARLAAHLFHRQSDTRPKLLFHFPGQDTSGFCFKNGAHLKYWTGRKSLLWIHRIVA